MIIVSDSPSSQYRNRYVIKLVSENVLPALGFTSLEWLYTESGHGKGAPDGIGSAIKRRADNRVCLGTNLRCSSDIVDDCQEWGSKIIVKEVLESDIDVFASILDKSMIPQLVGIGKAHQVLYKDNSLLYRSLACVHCSPQRFCSCYDPITLDLEADTSGNNINTAAAASECSTSTEQSAGNIKDIFQVSKETEEEQRLLVDSTIRRFRENIDLKNFCVEEVPLDGNCFFTALAIDLSASEEENTKAWTPKYLRQITCDYISQLEAKDKDEISDFLTQASLEKYMQAMGKEGTYVDHIAIKSVSHALKRCIVIVHDDTADDVVVNPEFGNRSYVGYIPSISHYVAVQRKIIIQPGQYYAVDFVDKYFIGVCLNQLDNGLWRMKYLQHSTLKGGKEYFFWPMVRLKCLHFLYKVYLIQVPYNIFIHILDR